MFFFSTRKESGFYNYIIKGVKLKIKEKYNTKVIYYNIPKKITFCFLYIFFLNLINLNLFRPKKIIKIKYKGCLIGRHVLAHVYRDLSSYRNIYYFYKNLIKSFLIGGLIVDHAYQLSKKVKFVYIDHIGYLNGLYFKVFLIKKKIIFSNGYPRGLYYIDARKRFTKNLEIEDSEQNIVDWKNNFSFVGPATTLLLLHIFVEKSLSSLCKHFSPSRTIRPKKNSDESVFQSYIRFLTLECSINFKISNSSDVVGNSSLKINNVLKLDYNFAIDQNYRELNSNEIAADLLFNNAKFNVSYLEEKNHVGNAEYIKTGFDLEVNNSSELSFSTKRNLLTSSAEFYNLSYNYINDCLKAGIVFRREFYTDRDIEPDNSLMFRISVIPFGNISSPKLSK